MISPYFLLLILQLICDDNALRFGLFTNCSFPSLVSTDPAVRKASLEAKKKYKTKELFIFINVCDVGLKSIKLNATSARMFTKL